MAIALPHSLTQMPVSRFWIFWLQFTAAGLRQSAAVA